MAIDAAKRGQADMKLTFLGWLVGFEAPPRTTYLTHGEPVAADAMRLCIEEKLAWECRVPDYRECVEIG